MPIETITPTRDGRSEIGKRKPGLWLDKASLEIWRITAKPEPNSPEVNPLALVRITPEETQASNGAMVMRIRHRKPVDGLRALPIAAPFCLARSTAQSLAQEAAKHDATVIDETDDVWARFVSMDKLGGMDGLPMYGESEFRSVAQSEPSRPFPTLHKIQSPDGPPKATVILDAAMLTQIAAVAKAMKGASVRLCFEARGPEDMVRITVADDEEDRFLAHIMPIRPKEDS